MTYAVDLPAACFEPADPLLAMTRDIVTSYVACNAVPAKDLGRVIIDVHGVLRGLAASPTSSAKASEVRPVPAVPVKQSVDPDFLVCLDCGARLQMLKRHVRECHGLSVDAYRARWNLPGDYPIVAPEYRKQRSDFAKSIGLGKTRGRHGRKPPSYAKASEGRA